MPVDKNGKRQTGFTPYWQSWLGCTASCGEGYQTRTLLCFRKNGSYTIPCKQRRSCHKPQCRGKY